MRNVYSVVGHTGANCARHKDKKVHPSCANRIEYRWQYVSRRWLQHHW